MPDSGTLLTIDQSNTAQFTFDRPSGSVATNPFVLEVISVFIIVFSSIVRESDRPTLASNVGLSLTSSTETVTIVIATKPPPS